MAEIDWRAVSQAMRARRRMQEPRVCQVCGKEFVGASYAEYCGRVCANAAYWDRHREELNRKRRERYERQKAGQ